jgi:hypothetical protein
MAEIKDTMGKIAGNRNPVEELLLKIPGFDGYMNKQTRRESDKLHRDYISQKLNETKVHLNQVKVDMVDDGNIFDLDLIDKIQDKLDAIISRITYADRGYSGFFDTNKIGDKELEMIHQLDLALIGYVTTIEEAISKLSAELESKELKSVVKEAVKAVVELTAKFEERDNVVSGVV